MIRQPIALLASIFISIHALGGIDPIVDAEDRRLPDAEILKSSAQAKDSRLRARVALAYGRIQSPKGIDALLKLSHDENAEVRKVAAFSLGQLGWQAQFSDGREAEIQDRLSAMASDKVLLVRKEAIGALGKIGLEKTPELVVSALHSKEPALRAEAVWALFRYRLVMKLRETDKNLADLPQSTFNRLVALSEDPDAVVRRNVAYFFARTVDSRGEKILGALARDRHQWTRVYSLIGLAKMKAKSSRPVFARALRDSESSVRVAALGGMLAAAENSGEFTFLEKDRSHHVRAAFAQTLDAQKPAEVAVLERLLKSDASATVRAEALKGLAKAKDQLEPWLLGHLRDSRFIIREAAVQASERLSIEARERFLQAAMADSNPLVKGAVLEALAPNPSRSAFEALAKALESDALIERGTAVTALKERKETEVIELAVKTYDASADRRWIEVRQELVDILAKSVSDRTTIVLKRIIETDGDRSVQQRAERALALRGIKDIPTARPTSLSLSPFRETTLKENPVITLKTSKGEMQIECFAKAAPIHVASLVGLVKSRALDGLSFHRVVSNFVVQGADPDGTGFGDSGYSLRAEINRVPYERGTLGMPRSQGFDTGGSQIFLTHLPTPHLDGQYTVFGKITRGLDVLDRIERGDKIVSARVLEKRFSVSPAK